MGTRSTTERNATNMPVSDAAVESLSEMRTRLRRQFQYSQKHLIYFQCQKL